MKNYIAILLSIFLIGCTMVKGPSTITTTLNGVKFDSPRPSKMTMEKDGAIYTYDSQEPSLFSKILGAVGIGAVAASRR